STFECESESPSTQARSASHGQRKNCLPRRLLARRVWRAAYFAVLLDNMTMLLQLDISS
ncbi:hypothetical protein RCH08_001783, partial [Janthinobacterium sp. CG_S6]|nr:hypothetical protein [Janthinobacterium sp. CG_S6]